MTDISLLSVKSISLSYKPFICTNTSTLNVATMHITDNGGRKTTSTLFVLFDDVSRLDRAVDAFNAIMNGD